VREASHRPRAILPTAASIGFAVVVIAASARIDVPIPGSPVPQSLQTLAVLIAGGVLGFRGGTLAIAVYLAAGAAGAPVFAGGAGGGAHLLGPTAGYLLGFAVAGGIAGALGDADMLSRFPAAFGWMLAGHAIILVLGGLGLATQLGAGTAFAQGVLPFLWGGVAKSLVAAAVVGPARRAFDGTGQPPLDDSARPAAHAGPTRPVSTASETWSDDSTSERSR
jgi:biotin transport system substrate-specific component